MKRRSWVLAASLAVGTMAVACGIDSVGSLLDPTPDAASTGATTPSNNDDGAAPTPQDGAIDDDAESVEVVTSDAGTETDADTDAQTDAESDADADGAVCLPTGTSCDGGTAATCCDLTCNAYAKCGKCKTTTTSSSSCADSRDCCLGLFCGRRPFETAHCYQCYGRNEHCSADIMCCSGGCGKNGKCD